MNLVPHPLYNRNKVPVHDLASHSISHIWTTIWT